MTMREPSFHELKTLPTFFEEVYTGRKTFEIRKDDRGFRVSDTLWLREFNPVGGVYTGRSCTKRVTYITNFAQQEGVVVMGLGISEYHSTYDYSTLLVHKTVGAAAHARKVLGIEGQPLGFGGDTTGGQWNRIIILGAPARRSATAERHNAWIDMLNTRMRPRNNGVEDTY